jgi:phage gpG-like protein
MATLKQVSLSKFDQACREASRVMDFTPVLKAIRVDVVAVTRENFDKSTTADGKPWAPLKRPRPNSAGNDQPLRDFGILMASVTSPGAQGNIDEQNGRRIEWGTNLDYAAIHQYGGIITPKVAKLLAIPATVLAQRTGSPRNWPDGELKFHFGKGGGAGVAKNLAGEIQYYFARSVTIPAREFLGLTKEQADEYGEWAADYAVEQVAKSFEGGG